MGVFYDYIRKAQQAVNPNPLANADWQAAVAKATGKPVAPVGGITVAPATTGTVTAGKPAPSEFIQQIRRERNPFGGFQENMIGKVTSPAGDVAGTKPGDQGAMGWLREVLGPTPAEREAMMKRAQEGKAKMAAWTGLFDGLRHLGNLYATTKGAPSQQYTDNPMGMVEHNYQEQVKRADDLANQQRQYAQMVYNLQRQGQQDELAKLTAQARAKYWDTMAKSSGGKAQAAQETAAARIANIKARTKQIEDLSDLQKQKLQALIKKYNHDAKRPYNSRGGSSDMTFEELAANLNDYPEIMGPILQEEGLGFYDEETNQFYFTKNATNGMAKTANERARRQSGGGGGRKKNPMGSDSDTSTSKKQNPMG